MLYCGDNHVGEDAKLTVEEFPKTVKFGVLLRISGLLL